MWEDGTVAMGACNGMSPDGGEAIIGEGENRSRGLKLVGTEEAVVIAVGRHIRLIPVGWMGGGSCKGRMWVVW